MVIKRRTDISSELIKKNLIREIRDRFKLITSEHFQLRGLTRAALLLLLFLFFFSSRQTFALRLSAAGKLQKGPAETWSPDGSGCGNKRAPPGEFSQDAPAVQIRRRGKSSLLGRLALFLRIFCGAVKFAGSSGSEE